MLPEPIAVTLQVIDVLEALGVPYLMGGSFASSVYGTYRATADVDLVADLKFEQVGRWSTLCAGNFISTMSRCVTQFDIDEVSAPSTWRRCSRLMCSFRSSDRIAKCNLSDACGELLA